MTHTPLSSDEFLDSAIGVRGERWTEPTLYWPTLLWNNGTEGLTGFNLACDWGSLHDGYLATDGVAACSRRPTSSNRAMPFFTLRNEKRLNHSLEATFQMKNQSGGDFFHNKATWCTLGARIQGETDTQFWSEAGYNEALNAPTGYYFSMATRYINSPTFDTSIGFSIYKVTGPAASGGNSTIDHMNDGPPKSGLSGAVNEAWYAHLADAYIDGAPEQKLRMEVFDDSGSVTIFGYWTNTITGVEELVAKASDYSGAITGEGHCGFGMTSEIQDSGQEWIHGIKYFQVKDYHVPGTVIFRDEFTRGHTHAFQRFSDLLGTDCRMISGAYTGDQAGVSQSGEALDFQGRLVRDSLNEKLESDGTPVGGWHLDVSPASNIYVQSCSAKVEMGTGAVSREVALGVRMDLTGDDGWLNVNAGTGKTGYALGIAITSGGVWAARIYRFEAGDTLTIVAARVLNATDDPFIASVAVPFTVRFDVQNVNGSSQTNGSVKLIPLLDGVMLEGWILAGGTTEETGYLLDAGDDRVLSGTSIGFYSATLGTPSIFVHSFTRNAVVYQNDERDLGGISLPVEQSVRTDDTLTLNHEWPVRVGYVSYALEQQFASEHEHRHATATSKRRIWTISSRAATQTEVEGLVTFFEDHDGVGLGFKWVTPDGETVKVAFRDNSIRKVKVSAGVYTFSVQVIELLGPDLPTVSFEMFGSSIVTPSVGGIEIVDYPAGSPGYPVFFFQDDDVSFDVTILLAEAATRDLDIAYEITGTAVEGTNYSIPTASESPVTIAAGLTELTITFNILNTGLYHLEKRMEIKMLSGQTEATVNGDVDELHAYIRTTTAPPLLEFNASTSSPSVGDLHQIQVDKVGSDHEDNVALYFKIDEDSTDAVEGVDYTFIPSPGALHGLYGIPPLNTLRTLYVQIELSATVGRKLVLDLYHEREGELDKNLWTNTDTMEMDVSDGQDTGRFPTEPGDCAPGPAGLLPPHPLSIGFDSTLVDPLGLPLPTLKLRSDARGSGYHRKNSEAQVFCAGTTTLHSQKEYSRVSVYVRKATGIDLPRFVQLIWRDRGFQMAAPQDAPESGTSVDEEHVVVFDNQSPNSGAITYEGNAWDVYAEVDLSSGSESGIELETHRMSDGSSEQLLRLWFIYREPRLERLGEATNILIRPAYFGGNPPVPESLATNINKGMCVYNLFHEMSDTPLTGPPPQFFPRNAMSWEPLGNAVVPTASGSITRHTVTIA